MKKWLSFLLVPAFLALLLSCDTDPYRGKRPIDAPDSYWECVGEHYKISFQVGHPEEFGITTDEDQSVPFEFLWSSLDSGVSAYEYGHSGDWDYYLFGGKCTFGKKTFEIKVDSVGDNWSILSDELTFERME